MLEQFIEVADLFLVPFFGNPLIDYLGLLLFIFVSYLVSKLCAQFITTIAEYITKRTTTALDELIVANIKRPLQWILLVGALYGLLAYTGLSFQNEFVRKSLRLLSLVITAWFVADVADALVQIYFTPKTGQNKIYKQMLPVMRRLVSIGVWTFALVFLLDNLGVNVATLLAGLGIGGLAVAFAAKETIENLIAGFLLFIDRPFVVGDWIKIGDIEGTVDQVGLRETVVKGWDKKRIIIPNRNIVSTPVENYSLRKSRRVDLEFRLSYRNTSAKIKKAKELIAKILDKYPAVGAEDRFIRFMNIKEDHYHLLAYYWVIDMAKWADTKESVNFAIIEAFKKAKIELAYPTKASVSLKR